MSQYIVSARKYRPDSFESLIGQDTIAQTLKNSIRRNQLAHAYLFCGPRGVGKTSAARIFAKIINCENLSEDVEPCGHCESCISFQEGRSYCIHELDAASNNGVDDIKALMEQVQIPPQVGRHSVYIIDEVHMLSAAAFNAFLKTLEEPPAHAIFILATTEKHKILPTIMSRCQTYDFNRISIPDIVRNLTSIAQKEGITIDQDSLHVIAQKADGAMRDALTIFDQTVAFCGTEVKYEDVLRNLNVLDTEHCFQLVDFFLAGDYQSALLKFDEILQRGFNALHFVSALNSHFRDLLVAKGGGVDSLLNQSDSQKSRYREQASRCSLQFIYDALGICSACEAGYRTSVNPRLHIEFSLMKLSFYNSAMVAVTPQQRAAMQQKGSVQPQQTSQKPVQQTIQQPAPQQPTETPKPPAAQQVPAQQTLAQQAPAAQNPPALQQTAPAMAQPQQRRRGSHTGLSMSMSSAIKQRNAQTDSAATRSSIIEVFIPTDEQVLSAWKKLPEVYAARERLAQTLATAKTSIHEKDGNKILTFFVLNVPQQQWIQERILHDIEGKLIGIIGTPLLKVTVDVTPDEEIEVQPYTAKEKAKALMDQNEEVQHLVKDFKLDV